MTCKEILLKLELIECELDDATNQMPEYSANSDALTSIDCAKNELYNLRDEIERSVLDNKTIPGFEKTMGMLENL